jgi:tellurite methyltransferase
MEKYNKIYSSSNVSEDIKPSQTISLIWDNFISSGSILDLGCGRGRDSIFLAKNDFLVTAIDSSEVVINQIKAKKNEFSLENLELICGDISDFKIENGKYDAIICRNVLNFLDKGKALEILNNIKGNAKIGSYIIVDIFTKDDPSFTGDNKFTCYFEKQELLNIFADFKVIYYLENIILDNGHPGFETPHKHGVSKIIVQK